MFDEKTMENLIAADPEHYLGEPGLELIGRQLTVADYRFDLLFRDRTGAKLIVEIQKGTLDRAHTYKILDYYEAFKERHPHEFVDVMVVANVIPAERKQRLSSKGIAYREIPAAEFLGKSATRANSVPGQVQTQSSIAFADSANSIIEKPPGEGTPSSAFALFKDQQERFSKALQDYDPTVWFPALRGHFKEQDRGNWFICFVPGAWGRWRSKNYGVHFDFAYGRAKKALPERFRLAVGVETPLRKQHWQAFKEDVISRVRAKGIVQSGFILQAKERTKLLEADPIPFNSQSWQVAIDRYFALQPVISVIAQLIKEYHAREAFDAANEF